MHHMLVCGSHLNGLTERVDVYVLEQCRRVDDAQKISIDSKVCAFHTPGTKLEQCQCLVEPMDDLHKGLASQSIPHIASDTTSLCEGRLALRRQIAAISVYHCMPLLQTSSMI